MNNPQVLSPKFFLSTEVVDIDGKKVIHIYVPESSQPHSYKGHLYDRNEDGVKLTIWHEAEAVGVNVGVNEILNIISKNEGINGATISQKLPEVTKRTVERYLQKLRENGVIDFRGALNLTPQSPPPNSTSDNQYPPSLCTPSCSDTLNPENIPSH